MILSLKSLDVQTDHYIQKSILHLLQFKHLFKNFLWYVILCSRIIYYMHEMLFFYSELFSLFSIGFATLYCRHDLIILIFN